MVGQASITFVTLGEPATFVAQQGGCKSTPVQKYQDLVIVAQVFGNQADKPS